MAIPGLTSWASRAVWLLAGVALVCAALPVCMAGFAEDAAVPVPVYLVMGYTVSRDDYARAARMLEASAPYSPRDYLTEAEAMTHLGASHKKVIATLEKGLAASPASVRGWTILAEQRAPTDRNGAAKALEQALVLAPFDYWLAGRRAHDAAGLWDALGHDARDQAVIQARLLWDEPLLRSEVAPFVKDPAGAALMSRALKDEPEEIRRLNRWMVGK